MKETFKVQPDVTAKYVVLAKNPVLLIPGYGTVDFRKIDAAQADKLFNSKNGSLYLRPVPAPAAEAKSPAAEKPAKKAAAAKETEVSS